MQLKKKKVSSIYSKWNVIYLQPCQTAEKRYN